MNISILDFKLKKMKLFNLSVLTLLLSIGPFSNTLLGQVTIGSSIKPAQGALLDLKQKEDAESINGGQNSKAGLLLPRVELKEVNKLIMGTTVIQDTDNDGDQYIKHAGLVVYNVATNKTICPGLYVWSGSQWDRLFDDDCVVAPKLKLDIEVPEPLFFYNGQYGNTDYSKYVVVTWDPKESKPTYEITNVEDYPPVALGTPGAIDPKLPWTTPQTVKITPAAMTKQELDAYPFLVKKSKLKVKLVEGDEEVSKEVEVTQENKALLIDGSLNPKVIKLKPSITKYTFDTQANAQWKLLRHNIGVGLGVESATRYEGGTDMMVELAGARPDIQPVMLTTRTGAAKPYVYLTFTDVETPKRFNDVYITIAQCAPGEDLSVLGEYREIIKNKYGIESVDSSGDLSKNPNQVQYHADQDGGLFFSAMFGNDRWMTTNLAVTKYAPDSPYAGTKLTNGINGFKETRNYFAYPMPHGSTTQRDTYYKARPRIGFLYSWFTASGLREPIPGGPEEWDVNPIRQGICPTGWHLPTPQEMVRLEMELSANAQKYSSNVEITKTTATARDMCDINPRASVEGQSHTIIDGGFSALFVGGAGQVTDHVELGKK